MAQSTRTTDTLCGEWIIESSQFEDSETGDCIDVFGAKPRGYLIITRDGRLMAMITSRERVGPSIDQGDAALFKSMMAYTGKFRLEDDDKFVTSVDLAWHPAWEGTEQVRFFKLDGDTLSITTAPQTHPLMAGKTGRGILVLKRR